MVEQIKTREYFENKYAKELNEWRQEQDSRQRECMEHLIDEGMTESDFIGCILGVEKEKLYKLIELCEIMFHPENQPPQFSNEEAWIKLKEIIK